MIYVTKGRKAANKPETLTWWCQAS